jgi:hypothetical protein
MMPALGGTAGTPGFLTTLGTWSDALLPLSLLTLLLDQDGQAVGMALVLILWLTVKLVMRREAQPYNWLLLFLLATQINPILSDAKYPASTFSDLVLPVAAFAAGFGQDRNSWRRAILMTLAIAPVGLIVLRPDMADQPFLLPLSLIGVNRNRTAFIFGFVAVLATCLFSRSSAANSRRWLAAGALLSFLVCLGTSSRAGAIIPVAAAVLAIWPGSARANHEPPRQPGIPVRLRRPSTWFALSILTLVSAAFLSWYLPLNPSFQRNQLSDLGRLAVARCYVEQAGQSANVLLQGLGQGSDRVAKRCRAATPWARKGKGLAHAHNNFIQLLGENGLPAMALAIGFLIAVARACRHAWRLASDAEERMVATAALGILLYIVLYSFADGTLIRLPLQQVLHGYGLALPFALTTAPRSPT